MISPNTYSRSYPSYHSSQYCIVPLCPTMSDRTIHIHPIVLLILHTSINYSIPACIVPTSHITRPILSYIISILSMSPYIQPMLHQLPGLLHILYDPSSSIHTYLIVQSTSVLIFFIPATSHQSCHSLCPSIHTTA